MAELVSISNKEYHSEKEHVSASKLKSILTSPHHFFNYKPMAPRPEFVIGNAYECLILEEDKFNDQFFIMDDRKQVNSLKGKYKNPRNTNDYREWVAGQRSEAGDREILTWEDMEMIDKMVHNTLCNEFIILMLGRGVIQQSVFFEYNGVKLKTRPDFIRVQSGMIVDLKTTATEGPSQFSTQMAKLNYPLQAIMQIEGCKAAGIDVKDYFYLVGEKTGMNLSALYNLQDETIRFARVQLDKATDLLKRCQDSGKWPGYEYDCGNDAGVINLNLPAWAIK